MIIPTSAGQHRHPTANDIRLLAPRRGAAALELAIVLPVLLLLIFGCVDFARIAYCSVIVNSAAGAGMTYATTHRFTALTRANWEEQLALAVEEELQGIPDYQSGKKSFAVTTSIAPDQTVSISITVSYPFQTIVNWPGLPSQIRMSQSLSGNQYR